jgi:hypothetical protein
MAANTPHVSYEQLPVLADYDAADYLRANYFPVGRRELILKR